MSNATLTTYRKNWGRIFSAFRPLASRLCSSAILKISHHTNTIETMNYELDNQVFAICTCLFSVLRLLSCLFETNSLSAFMVSKIIFFARVKKYIFSTFYISYINLKELISNDLDVSKTPLNNQKNLKGTNTCLYTVDKKYKMYLLMNMTHK